MKREPAPGEIEELERLFHASRFTDAHARLDTFSNPETWASPRARVAAGRLLGNLGAPARARRLMLTTWRRDQTDALARYFVLLDFSERHGPLETLRLLDELGRADPTLAIPQDEAAEPTVFLWLLRARCLALCRDFDAAEEWLAAGERAQPNHPWTFVERAMCLEHADRYPEALQAIKRAVALRPGYARAVWLFSHLLTLMRRDGEALALLQRETAAGQSAHLALQLGSLLSEFERPAEALAAFELAARRFLVAEKSIDDFIRGRRADLLHRLGRDTEAAPTARGLKGRYWENFAARLAEPGTGARIQLPVPFVRQHHVTCAPATLAAVSVYLGSPIEHETLARAITYDGTPDHEERHWLEANGWAVREFRVTWETAVALLSQHLPFTLVTTWTGSAHLQAVIGSDERLGTLIIRDPYQRESYEALAAELLEQQQPYGPRGMVFVPLADAARISGLPLPDAPAYDEWFTLRRKLLVHDRAAAAEAARRLQAAAPGSRLALWAERHLAYYDDNPARALSAVTALRAKFPADANLQVEELALLSRLGRRVEHRDRVAAIMRSKKPDPVIWREQVELWRADARQHGRALRLAKRFARARPYDWIARYTLAHVLWDRGEFRTALQLYRLAAAGGEKSEPAWRSFFAAARHTGGAAAAVAMLEARHRRLGDQSSEPAITLARALDQLDQMAAIPAVLEAALQRRKDDGDLLLELALVAGRTGAPENAGRHLAAARAKISPPAWHRAAAQLAAWRADHAQALGHNEALLAENPLDIVALSEIARLRAITTGPAAVLAWLAECVARHPHFLPLRQLRLEWLRSRPVNEAISEVAEFLALEPTHAWALREQAIILLRAGRASDALASARMAEEVEPGVPHSAGLVGQSLLTQRDFAGARAATERALRIDIGAEWLMPQLLAACPEFADRVAAVAFLREELERQPAPVAGFQRFREVATGVLAPEELWEVLDALRGSQLERWEPWSACIQQLIAMGRSNPARTIAQQAAEKFPLVPRAWLDLADAHRLAGAVAEEEAALVRAREISPGWRDAAFRLASLLQRTLRLADSEGVLQATLAHDPSDAGLRLWLAEVFWRTGRTAEAIAAAERSAEAAPAWSEPWSRLTEWCRETKQPDRVIEFARQVAAHRSGDAHVRRQVAHILDQRGDQRAALEEAEAAVKLNPLDPDFHDLRAYLLCRLGQRDEALAACAPAALADCPAHQLAGRAAWVRWQFNERRAALDAMSAVTAAHPDYAWGWQQLAEWYGATDENDRAAKAAEKYAELCPGEPPAWGWVAAFKIKAGQGVAAMPILERALRLDPTYRYASFQLLKTAAENSRWPEADRALALIRQHASRWRALQCEVLYYRFRHDKPAALAALRQLALAPTHETAELVEAIDHFNSAGWRREVESPLRDVLARPDVNPETGAIWMRARLEGVTAGRPRIRWIERCGAADATRRTAWRTYLEWLAHHQSTLLVRWHLWRRGKWLAENDATWGTASYVLITLRWYRRVVRWMYDWRERKDLEPWMLNNLAHAMIATRRWDEMSDLVAAAMRLPADQTRGAFVVWAAQMAAHRSDYHRAAELLATFENPHQDPYTALFAEQARTITDVGMALPAARRKKLSEVRGRMAAVQKRFPGEANLSYMARENRRALHAAARIAGSAWQWWYAIPPLRAYLPTRGAPLAGTLVALAILIAAVGAGAPAVLIAFGILLARLVSPRNAPR